ncbi:hypothetical protein MLD38_037918 [Melastoma candidum]|uniref:Uncharacterized protein n=1 Tax=Melastoma candidum TaxID=119954 RepID=A0ACB9KXD3_9MYRT|nr:hypothetical protein MLD38_037918 [Melastoma candidum]
MVITTITVDEPTPGLKAIFSFILPDQKSGKARSDYQHEYAGISSSIGLIATPIVNFSGVVGNTSLALGTDVSFDTASGNLSKYNAGLSYFTGDLIASLTVNKGDTVSASYYHTISPRATQRASAAIQHEFLPRSLFTISGEVDARTIDKNAKIGLALALKP